MKKKLANTKCTVKLRKSEYRDEWYLIIDIYPIYRNSDGKPSRIKEGVNRSITTPIWDKNRIAKTNPDGSVTYRPKRDNNGIIMCRSAVDNEACIYADKVRELRQREYDNQELYTESEAAMAAQNERSGSNFIDYFRAEINRRHKVNSESIRINWNRVYELLRIFNESDILPFGKIDLKLIEDFKQYMLTAPQGGKKKWYLEILRPHISQYLRPR